MKISGHKLQYVSDLHLELRNGEIPIIEPVEPGNSYLALCGDIGNPYLLGYRKFISIHSKKFVHILLVSGNHEYYSGKNRQNTINTIDQKIEKIASEFNNVTYLNMNGVIIGRTKFIGCTFWSDVSDILDIAESVMSDYKNIYIDCPGMSASKHIKPDRRKLKSTDVVLIHNTMKEWITKQIDKYDPKDQNNKYDKIIILTHHAPSFSILTRSDIYSPCYATNCHDLFGTPISYWISGHAHFCKSVVINNIPSLSNCMGYPGENIPNFHPDKCIIFV